MTRKTPKDVGQKDKEARLAEKLRANLRRRKAATRKMSTKTKPKSVAKKP